MSYHLQLAAPFTAAEAPAACLHYQRRRPTTSQLCSAASISFPFRPVFFTARKLTSSSSSSPSPSPLRCFAGLSPELKSGLDKVVNSNKVILFMKGSKDFPECGFSNTVVQILKSLNVPFESINILENEMLRQGLKEYSSWPTFPQLYIDGEFFGGCDITVGGKLEMALVCENSQPGNGHGRGVVVYMKMLNACVVRILDLVRLMNNSETEAYKSGELQEVLEKAMCS